MQPLSSSIPVDHTRYVSYMEGIQQAQPAKPLSKEERVQAICGIYQQLIDLEEQRDKDPLQLKVDQHWTYAHHVDGSVVTIITKSYRYISHFSPEDLQKQSEDLMKQLEELDPYAFMETLGEEPETLNQIMQLVSKWSELVQKNANAFEKVAEEQARLQAEDAKEGFKTICSNNSLS